MNFKILCKSFEARTKPYQIKQTESKSAKKWQRSSIFHWFWINLHKFCIINEFQNFCVQVLKPAPSPTDKNKTESKIGQENDREVAFFHWFWARTHGRHGHTHTYGARFIVPSLTSLGGDNNCHPISQCRR